MTAVKRTLAKQRLLVASLRASISTAEAQGLPTGAGEDGRWARGRADRWNMDSSRYHAHWERRAAAANDYMGFDDELLAGDLDSASKLLSTDALGFRSLFLTDCARFLEQREFEFRRYTEYAEDLERAVTYKMDWTKDRQENAIYAFTIVTIIFLPLSAISSIFGMNTSDVRDMEFGQWLYWAVAVPVTAIIIVLGLWWMNELGNVARWMVGGRPGRAAGAHGAGHAAGPLPAAELDGMPAYLMGPGMPAPAPRAEVLLEAPEGRAERRHIRPQRTLSYAAR